MTSYSRRGLISGSISGTVLLVGCTLLREPDDLYQIELDNNTSEYQQVSVEVLDEDNQTLYEETAELGANMMDETLDPFSGEPAKIIVTVNDADSITTNWPRQVVEVHADSPAEFVQAGCSSTPGETVTGLFIHIEGLERIVLEPTCGSPANS